MSKQVAKKEDTTVSTEVVEFGAFGGENVITQDLQFPKLLLMQGLSQWVSDGLASPGDILESYEKQKLGSAKQPVVVIPFFNLNVWKLKKKVNGKFETKGYEDRTAVESRLDREFKWPDGAEGLREKTFNLFLLVQGRNNQVPYMVGFTNYSFKHAAQSYINKLQLLKAENKSPAHVLWNLGVVMEENDKGKFPVFTLETVKGADGKDIATPIEDLKAAYTQYKQLSAAIDSGAKVDMASAEDAQEAPAQNTRF